jgi:DNA-binding NarL/FixJ family response regulator
LIVDDDPRQLRALRGLLASVAEVFTASDADEARLAIVRDAPDVVVTDHALGHGTGLDVLRAGHAAQLPVIIVTAFGTKDLAIRSINERAFGLLEKPLDPAALLAMIASAFEERALRIARSTPETRAHRIGRASARWDLTPRQTEVLDLVAQGHANRTIAELLGCSTRTVEVHVTALLEKAGLESRAALIARFWSDP